MERPDFMFRLTGCTLKDNDNLLKLFSYFLISESLLWGCQIVQAKVHMAEMHVWLNNWKALKLSS